MYQPQTLVPVNRLNPLTRGILFCAIPAIGYDAVSMTVAEKHAYETSRNWLNIPGDHGMTHYISGQPSVQVYPGSRKANFDGGDFTMLCMMDAADNSAQTFSGMMGKHDASDDLNPSNWSMGAKSDNSFILGAYYAGGDIDFGFNNPNALLPRKNAQYAITGTGSTVQLYVDAVLNTTFSARTRPGYTTGNKSAIRIGCNKEFAPADNYLGNYWLAAVWKRALSPFELAAIRNDPWQLFAQNRFVFGR